jgi:hypothetical protein
VRVEVKDQSLTPYYIADKTKSQEEKQGGELSLMLAVLLLV